MTELTLSLITEADIPTLQDLARSIYFNHYQHLWEDGGDWYFNHIYDTSVVKTEIKDANAMYCLVCEKDEPVGYLKLNLRSPLSIGGQIFEKNALEVQRIYLHSTGKGIGNQVMTLVVDMAKRMQRNIVWLGVMESSQQAQRFYEKHGFEVCDKIILNYEKMYPQLRGLLIMKKNVE
jgi:diamine N-acetyltransferase